jgi:hypothetical protein
MLAEVVPCILVGIDAAPIDVERDVPPSTAVDLGATVDLVIRIR